MEFPNIFSEELKYLKSNHFLKWYDYDDSDVPAMLNAVRNNQKIISAIKHDTRYGVNSYSGKYITQHVPSEVTCHHSGYSLHQSIFVVQHIIRDGLTSIIQAINDYNLKKNYI